MDYRRIIINSVRIQIGRMKGYVLGIVAGLLQLIFIPNHFILAVTVPPVLAVVIVAFSTGFIAIKWEK